MPEGNIEREGPMGYDIVQEARRIIEFQINLKDFFMNVNTHWTCWDDKDPEVFRNEIKKIAESSPEYSEFCEEILKSFDSGETNFDELIKVKKEALLKAGKIREDNFPDQNSRRQEGLMWHEEYDKIKTLIKSRLISAKSEDERKALRKEIHNPLLFIKSFGSELPEDFNEKIAQRIILDAVDDISGRNS